MDQWILLTFNNTLPFAVQRPKINGLVVLAAGVQPTRVESVDGEGASWPRAFVTDQGVYFLRLIKEKG